MKKKMMIIASNKQFLFAEPHLLGSHQHPQSQEPSYSENHTCKRTYTQQWAIKLRPLTHPPNHKLPFTRYELMTLANMHLVLMLQVDPRSDEQLEAALVALLTCKHRRCPAMPPILHRHTETYASTQRTTSQSAFAADSCHLTQKTTHANVPIHNNNRQRNPTHPPIHAHADTQRAQQAEVCLTSVST